LLLSFKKRFLPIRSIAVFKDELIGVISGFRRHSGTLLGVDW
jgi:hypothetical protein